MRSTRSDLRAALPWLGVAALFVVLVAWFWNRGPGLDRDDYALYLLHAESIVEGRPYTDTGFIGTPLDIAPPAQPPGLPLVLAATYLIAGGFSWTAVKLAMALLGLLAVLVPGLYFARQRGTAMGMAVSAFLAIAWAATSIQPETDVGFVALVWLVVALLDLPERDPGWGRALLVLAVGSFAMSYRMLGVVLVPTVAWFAFLNRKRAGFPSALPVVVWGLGGVLVLLMGGWRVVVTQLPSDPLHLVSRAATRVPVYGRMVVEAHLYPLPGDLPNDVFHVVSLALALVGLVSWTTTSWRTAAWGFAAGYGSLLLITSAASSRYLMPLFPVMVFGFLHGLEVVAELIAARRSGAPEAWSRRVTAVTAALVVTLASVRLLGEPRTGGYLLELADTESMVGALAEADASRPVRAAFVQPRVLTWSTGFPAMVIPYAQPARMLAELDRMGITHVIVDELGLANGRTRRMMRTIDEAACRFDLVHSNGSYRVYEVLPDCVVDRVSATR